MATTGTATLDFGSSPVNEGVVLVTGLSGLSVGTHKEAFVQADDSTADNTASDHRQLGKVGRFTCEYVSATTMNIYCDITIGFVVGTFTIHYVVV